MNGAAIIVSRRKLEEFINAEEFERELEKYMYDAKVELHLTDLTVEDFESDFRYTQHSFMRHQYLKEALLGGPIEDEYDRKIVEKMLAEKGLEESLKDLDKIIQMNKYDSIEDMINKCGYYKVIDGKIYTDHNDKGLFDSIIYVNYGPYATEEENTEMELAGFSWTDYTQGIWYLKGKNGEHVGSLKMSEWNGRWGESDMIPAFMMDADNNKMYVHEDGECDSLDVVEKEIDDNIKDLGEEDRYVYLFKFIC